MELSAEIIAVILACESPALLLPAFVFPAFPVQKAQAAVSSQLSTLADANRTMEEAADNREEEEEKDTETLGGKGADQNVSGLLPFFAYRLLWPDPA